MAGGRPQGVTGLEKKNNEEDYSFSKLWKELRYSKLSYAVRAGVEAVGGTSFLIDGIAHGRIVECLVAGILYVGAVGNFMDYKTTRSLESIANHTSELRNR